MMEDYRNFNDLMKAIDEIKSSPSDNGPVELIVRRPSIGMREEVASCEITLEEGMLGDCWKDHKTSSTADGNPHPGKQVNLVNSRAIAVIAGRKERWKLAGDQLYVDMDLSVENIPPGTKLQIGEVVLVVSDTKHRGCKKYAERYGRDAIKFVNSGIGLSLNLRGINTRVIRSGQVKVGQTVKKISIPNYQG